MTILFSVWYYTSRKPTDRPTSSLFVYTRRSRLGRDSHSSWFMLEILAPTSRRTRTVTSLLVAKLLWTSILDEKHSINSLTKNFFLFGAGRPTCSQCEQRQNMVYYLFVSWRSHVVVGGGRERERLVRAMVSRSCTWRLVQSLTFVRQFFLWPPCLLRKRRTNNRLATVDSPSWYLEGQGVVPGHMTRADQLTSLACCKEMILVSYVWDNRSSHKVIGFYVLLRDP